MTKPRIAIIGAGTGGCGCARRAAELGAAEVILIERETPAAGSSSRSAGVYNAQTTDPLHIEIRVRARELFFRLNEEGKLPLAKIGNLRPGGTAADVAAFEAALEVQRSLGAHDGQVLDPDAMRRLVPDLKTDDLAGGLFGPNDGHLDGYLLCTALVDEAKEHGAQLLAHAEVTGHAKRNGAHLLQTTQGEVECDVVVNATGAWAGRIGEMLGHPAGIKPQLHEVVQIKLPRELGYVVPMINTYMPGQAGQGVYFRQDGPDSMIAGLHSYDAVEGLDVADPDAFGPSEGDDYLMEVATLVSERLEVEGLGFKYGWCGLYPISADGQFQVGPYAADPSVAAVAGLGGVGVTSGAILGALAAEWIMLGKPTTLSAANAQALLPDRPDLASLAS